MPSPVEPYYGVWTKKWNPAIVNTGRGKTNDFGAKTRKNLHIIVFTPTSN